jgi:hypothetical protein
MTMKSLLGIAAATMLAAAVIPAPAIAAPIQNAPGIAELQSNVESVQYRRYNRRYVRAPVRRGVYRSGRYVYGGGPYYYGGGPYAYAAPYPYYRRYYAPRPFIGIGPFGFGVW